MDDNNRYYDVNSQLKCTDEEINRSLRSFHTKVFIQLNEEFLFFPSKNENRNDISIRCFSPLQISIDFSRPFVNYVV